MFVSRTDSAYLLGSGDHLQLFTKITNRGEDAFNSMLWVQLPPGLTFIKAELVGYGGFYIDLPTYIDLPKLLCSPSTVGELEVLTDHWTVMSNNTIVCEVGNPLEANRAITTIIYLMPSLEGFKTPGSELSFRISVNSANPEMQSDYQDNYEDFTVPIRLENHLEVAGKSDPLEVEYKKSYNTLYEREEDIGEEILHLYDVRNTGPFTISEAEVDILWPSYDDDGGHLLYLMGLESDREGVKCRSDQAFNFNPLHVLPASPRPRSSLSRVDVEESVTTSGGHWIWSEVNNKWEWEAVDVEAKYQRSPILR